jgi:hypothetical protein
MACMTSEIFFSVFWFAALLSHIKLNLMMCSLSHWQQSKQATYAGWMFYRVPFSWLSYFHLFSIILEQCELYYICNVLTRSCVLII